MRGPGSLTLMKEEALRARMAKKGRRTSATASSGGRTWAIGVVVVALLGAGAVAWYATRDGTAPARGGEECTPTGLHEHASYAVYVRNSSVSWNFPEFGFPRSGRLAGHLHLPAEHTIHLEGGTEHCTTFGRFFANALKSRLTPELLILDEEVHGGTSYADGENGDELRFFLKKKGDNWTETPDLPHYQPRDGDYMLVTYGAKSDGEIAWQQARIAPPDPREKPE